MRAGPKISLRATSGEGSNTTVGTIQRPRHRRFADLHGAGTALPQAVKSLPETGPVDGVALRAEADVGVERVSHPLAGEVVDQFVDEAVAELPGHEDGPRALAPGTVQLGHPPRQMAGGLAEVRVRQYHRRVVVPQLQLGGREPDSRTSGIWPPAGDGRITVREAIRTLAEEGYVISERDNSGGTFVSDLTAAQQAWTDRVRCDPNWAVDLIEYRKAIEIRAAELAVVRGSKADLAE